MQLHVILSTGVGVDLEQQAGCASTCCISCMLSAPLYSSGSFSSGCAHTDMCECACVQVHRPVYGPHPTRSLRGQVFYRAIVEGAARQGRDSLPELRGLRPRGTLQVKGRDLVLSRRKLPKRPREQ